jgi:hypothetical protein
MDPKSVLLEPLSDPLVGILLKHPRLQTATFATMVLLLGGVLLQRLAPHLAQSQSRLKVVNLFRKAIQSLSGCLPFLLFAGCLVGILGLRCILPRHDTWTS